MTLFTNTKTVQTSTYNGPGGNYAHSHDVAVSDLDYLVHQLNERLDLDPKEAVRRSFQDEGHAVVFVIVGGKSVPLQFKKGDNLEGLLTQLRLILG